MYRIEPDEAILVVVDIQERILSAMHDAQGITENCAKLIRGCRILGIPIIVTQQYTKGLGETVDEIKVALTEPIGEEGKTEEFRHVEKKSFSCMDEPTFKEALEKSERDSVIMCGIETHVCVQQTVADMYDEDYDVYLVADCVDSRKPYDKKIALKRMADEAAELMTTESVLFELLRMSDSPNFKEISKLIK